MHTYLLAINLFAVTALLLALMSLAKEIHSGRILPLYLLVISRSLMLISALVTAPQENFWAAIDVLEIFSTVCIIWTLTGPIPHLGSLRRRLIWVGAAGVGLIITLPLIPSWPVPPEIHALFIAIFGASLIYITRVEKHWTYLAVPLTLTLGFFLAPFGFTNTAWFIQMIAYVILNGAIHWQSLQISAYREQLVQNIVQEALEQDQEKQRILETSALLSTIPNLNHSFEHIVHTVAQTTHADQTAIFSINDHLGQEARLLTLYSPHRPFHINNPNEVTCLLPNCPPLQEVISKQKQLILPQQQINGLTSLYALWDETLSGPTLLQPLLLQGRPIGVLMIGNPLSQSPIRESDARLCHSLASQITTLVEYRRRYLKLEGEALAMTQTASRQHETSNSLQTAVLDTINDGVVVGNDQGRVQYVNRAAEHILGKSSQTLLGQSIGAIYGAIDSKEPIDDLMVSFSRRDQPLPTFLEQDDRAIQGRLIPWRNQQREWLGIIAIFREVTREVKADRARNDFIAGLSHQLRAPLTMIKGYAELTLNGTMGAYSKKQLHPHHVIFSNAEKMVELLDNAIKISAENRHRVLPRFEEVVIPKVIEAVQRELTSLIHLSEVKFSSEIEPDLPQIIADKRHLYRILYNLLSNACRFTPPGGQIKLRTWIETDKWGLTTQPSLFITVADNGIGIAQENLSRIFDRFYQVNPPNSESVGLGLGLTVVKELVELHQGRVWAESLTGQGSTFYVALPMTQEY